jgi:glycosyltransferase involved in cell wall biosynthesis
MQMDTLSIVLIGPGIISNPPKRSYAMIWNYFKELTNFGCNVSIINEPNRDEIIRQVKQKHPDFVHIQDDNFADLATICAKIVKCVAVTSHFSFIEQPTKWGEYLHVWQSCLHLVDDNIFHFALSPEIATIYKIHGTQKVYVTPNGVDPGVFAFKLQPKYLNRTICVGKKSESHHLVQHNPSVWFVRDKYDEEFDHMNHTRYLGEWDKQTLYSNLTDYANLVVISNGETDPLIVKEALSAGLGVVLLNCTKSSLMTSPFICIVSPEDALNQALVDDMIAKNRDISIASRLEIREYSKRFHWNHLVKKYYRLVTGLLKMQSDQTVLERTATIVSAYLNIPSKYSHEFYFSKILNLIQNVNQECVFWTTADMVNQFQPYANSYVKFQIIPGLPDCHQDFNDSFWQRQIEHDPEKYHTVELAKMWFLKRHFVLETTKLCSYPKNHNFIWCDAACIRDELSKQWLLQFGDRFYLEDERMHLQVLNPSNLVEFIVNETPFFTFSTKSIACAIMFGTAEAWLIYSNMYNDMLKLYDSAKISGTSDQYITLSCVKKNPWFFVLHESKHFCENQWFRFLQDI